MKAPGAEAAPAYANVAPAHVEEVLGGPRTAQVVEMPTAAVASVAGASAATGAVPTAPRQAPQIGRAHV